MDKNTIVIAIDHGWSACKTSNFVFCSGVREITTEPAIYDNVVQYDGRYFKIGSERLKVKDTKVEDDNYYILTLAAIATVRAIAVSFPFFPFSMFIPHFYFYIYNYIICYISLL